MKRGCLAALLLLSLALVGGPPSWAVSAPPPVREIAFVGEESTQLDLAELSIGVGYVGGGPAIDDKGVRRNGLHASIDISIEDKPSLYRQLDVHKGQVIRMDRYLLFHHHAYCVLLLG